MNESHIILNHLLQQYNQLSESHADIVRCTHSPFGNPIVSASLTHLYCSVLYVGSVQLKNSLPVASASFLLYLQNLNPLSQITIPFHSIQFNSVQFTNSSHFFSIVLGRKFFLSNFHFSSIISTILSKKISYHQDPSHQPTTTSYFSHTLRLTKYQNKHGPFQ